MIFNGYQENYGLPDGLPKILHLVPIEIYKNLIFNPQRVQVDPGMDKLKNGILGRKP